MNVQEIMTKPAITCGQHDRLNTVAHLMWEHDCGAIPVVDEGGSVVGIVTDRDICMAAYTQGAPLHDIPVTDAMAREVFSCGATASLEAAERLMGDKQIRRLPVVDGGNRAIGMLSLNDIALHAVTARKRNGLDREVTQTLAAICRPRSRALAPRRDQTQALVESHHATA